MSITIKQAFQKLAMVTGAAVKNPWFIGRNLNQAFADIADNIEGGGGGGSTVEVTQVLESGTKVATITVDDTPTDIFAPTPAEPTDVEVTQVVSTGTKIATITVDDTPTDIYAPSGGSGSDWTYINTVTGQTPVSLPSGWKEVLIYVEMPGTSAGVIVSVHVLSDVLAKAVYSKSFIAGGAASNDGYYASIEVTASTATLGYAWYVNGARTSDSKVVVYYK